jgi:ankyrin repeat protein
MTAKTEERFRQLYRAIKRSDLAAIRNALDSGISPDFADKFGWTLLMLAASKGTFAIGQLLVSNGADTNRTTRYRNAWFPEQTALSSSIIGGHPRFTKMLLDNGAMAGPELTGASVEDWLSVCHHDPMTMSALKDTFAHYRARKPN